MLVKPVYLSFQCFGPYMDRQEIDFAALEQNGLFLICGETGAGKSTILDAICYALYGKSSGGLRGDLSVMRCKLAGREDETRIEFVFDCGGRRYRFLRGLKAARKNINDYHDCQRLEDDVFVPMLENPKLTSVSQKAQEIIGLTYEQFRQVIILPQGQFEKLLVSDSAEKEKILVSLFGADRWQRIAEELYRRVAERDSALKAEKAAIAGKLREYGCETTDALAALLLQNQAQAQALEAQDQAAQTSLQTLRKTHEAALLIAREFDTLRSRAQESARLDADGERYQALQRQLECASRTEAILPLRTAARDADTTLRKRRSEHAAVSAALDKAAGRLAEETAARERVEKNRGLYDTVRQDIILLENARADYESLSAMQRAADEAADALGKAESSKKSAEVQAAVSEKKRDDALQTQEAAIARYQQAQRIYRQGIGGMLAQELTDGMPCPVCGSMHHPAPAVPSGERITDAELDRLESAMNEKNRLAAQARSAHAEKEAAREKARQHYNEAAQAAAVARRDLDAALERRLPGVDTLAALEKTLKTRQQSLERFDAEDRRTASSLTAAQGEFKAAESRLAAAQAELTAAGADAERKSAAFAAAIAQAGFDGEAQFAAACLPPERRDDMQRSLAQYRARVTDARNALAQQQKKLEITCEPDMKTLNDQLAQTERDCGDLRERLLLASDRVRRLQDDYAALLTRSAAYDAARTETDADLAFANRLRGSSGSSLQRYVLGVMLTSVTVQANRLLSGVYGGRYRLHRTDAIAGASRKGGLELEVSDAQSSERRSVTTLSGGEKFLVALSLAIGLSAVVQAQGSGIRLEAMFIDEGFGSLDRESVTDALEVLQGIQRTSGVVGIISHVEQLAETIPGKLEIVKGNRGSRIIPHL